MKSTKENILLRASVIVLSIILFIICFISIDIYLDTRTMEDKCERAGYCDAAYFKYQWFCTSYDGDVMLATNIKLIEGVEE